MRASGELGPFWVWGLRCVAPFVRLLFDVRLDGLEHVPSRGHAIVAFNHVSALDGVIVAVEIGRRLGRPTTFLVAAEFFDKPFFGWVLRGCAQVPIHRGGGDQEALEAFTGALRDGRLAGLAPEGRVDDHEGHEGLQRIRTGTARVAIPTGAPIVPLGLWGTQVRYPRKGFSLRRPWRPRLGMAFGPPIMPSDTEPTQEAIDDLTERIRIHLDEQVTRARRLAGGRP